MKKFIFLIIYLIIFLKFSAISCLAETRINYDLIYNETPVLDFMFEDRVDPDEEQDYSEYLISPYTLMRITDFLVCKNIKLKPGYYLVKAVKKDGYNVMIFKQNGKVTGVIPVYQRVEIDPTLVFPEPVKPKLPLYKAIPKKILIDTPKSILAWPLKKIFKEKKVPVPLKSAMETRTVENRKYLEMWLYVDKYLYKSLFKIEKYQ